MLCGCLVKGVRQKKAKLPELRLGRGLVYLHLLLDQMRPRLQAVLDMAACRPGAVDAVRLAGTGACAELLSAGDEVVSLC
jgi:hypothetical protein